MRLSFIVLLACISISTALVEKLDIDSDDRRAFHIESFGYEPDGHFEILLKDFSLMVTEDYEKPAGGKYNIAFVLQRTNTDSGLRLDDSTSDTCFHENPSSDEDLIISLASRHDWKRFVFTKQITEPGYYHLYFSNCEANTQVSFELELTEYNVDPDGRRNYLNAGESSLPTWYFLLCGLFVVLLAVWLNYLWQQWSDVKTIHHLMTGVVLLKICVLFTEAFRYHTLKLHGTHDAWSILYYIFSFLKGMLMFGVIVLIGTGWSYMKPFLTERDKQIMLVVMVVQAMVNIAMVVFDETTPGSVGWIRLRDILHLLDMVCCCMTLLPIVWSIRHLRSAAGEDTKDGKALRSMNRLKAFRSFYLLVVSYIYFTRIIVFLLGATLPFEYTWIGFVIGEAANAIFYCVTGWLFRPQNRNPYLLLDDIDPAEREPLSTQLSAL